MRGVLNGLDVTGNRWFDGRCAADDPWSELVGKGGESWSAAVEPAGQGGGCLLAREALEPDGLCATCAAGGAGTGDDDVATVALVETLGQRQPCRAACLKALESCELAARQRVELAKGLPGAEAASGETRSRLGETFRGIGSGGHRTRVPPAGITGVTRVEPSILR